MRSAALGRWTLILVVLLGAVLGACGASTPGPACLSDGACDDGNPCTEDTCDAAHGCLHDDSGAAALCDDGNLCTTDGCDPVAGCTHDGTGVTAACDDGDACTGSDACSGDVAGTCAGSPISCDDDNPCTADGCLATSGCTHDGSGITAACDDDSVCTVDDVCQGDAAGSCGGTPISCDDGNPCTADGCDALLGCVFDGSGVNAPCEDGDPCTSGDACAGDLAGTCQGGAPTDCDDNSPCTADACDPAVGCTHDGSGITVVCDDRNACTEDDVCRGDLAGTCAGTYVGAAGCDDDNVCTVDTCDARLGCVHDGTGIVRACDDSDPCTAGDACQGDVAGTCRGPRAADCDDSNPCTADGCDPASGCLHDGTGITDLCDDGSVCTLDDACQGDAAGSCTGEALDCDDGNFCTDDSCHPVQGCRNELAARLECFPVFRVDYPPRGATIQGQPSLPAVMVTGTVASGAGPITSFRINGTDVPLSGDGSFAQTVDTLVGGNTLVFEAVDSMGSYRKRVQAFLWSSEYRRPDPAAPGSGMSDPGLGIWLAQEVLDDGVHTLPPDDLATIFEMVLATMDLGSFIDPTTPITQQAGYDIYLTDLDKGGQSAALTAINGGMAIQASFVDVVGDLYFDCPCEDDTWLCGCWYTGGSGSGGLSVDSITITASIMVSVAADHTLVVTVVNPATNIQGLDIWSNNGWTNFLISLIEGIIHDQLIAQFEAELNDQLTTQLAPMLQEALSALAFNQSFDLPRLDGSGGAIAVQLVTDFSSTDFRVGGGAIRERAAGYAARATPYDNLGVPQRINCGTGLQQVVLPELSPFEISLADDTLNSLFHAAWFGGLLEFPIPPELLGDLELEPYGITELQLTLSGMLAPTASDCWPDGQLRIFLGDLRLDASFLFYGAPVDFIVWTTATMGLELTVADGLIAITITGVDGVETELQVLQDEYVGLIDLIGDGFGDLLVDVLMEALNGGQLATIPLPEIDLSAVLPDLPPGTVIALDPQIVERLDGNTVIRGDLR